MRWPRRAEAPKDDFPPEKVDETAIPLTNDVPDPVEWEESLIGIGPNSGLIDPPPVC